MKRVISLVLFLACVCVAASAQEFRGTLTGRVADPTGAVIPKATITITNEGTGAITRTVSGGDGFYTVPFLTPGKYSISVSVTGFKPYLHTGIEVLTQQTITENVKLEIGTTTDTVTVTSGSPLIDTATASTGQVLTEEEINDLPSNGRNPAWLRARCVWHRPQDEARNRGRDAIPELHSRRLFPRRRTLLVQ